MIFSAFPESGIPNPLATRITDLTDERVPAETKHRACWLFASHDDQRMIPVI